MSKVVSLTSQSPAVYLAGKMATNRGPRCITDWRLMFLRDVPKHYNCSAEELRREVYALSPSVECNGEWFIASQKCPPWTYIGPLFGMQHCVLDDAEHQTIFDLNLQCIRSSDMLFAFIDSYDCYGTLIEIGFAYGQGKRVYLAYDSPLRYRFNDFWFVTRCAQLTAICCNEVQLAKFFIQSLEHEQQKRQRITKIAEVSPF
jgi:hypothetical protein